jgi:membrane fusion protein (multidrug efflux system)
MPAMSGRQWFASAVLLLAIVATGGGLAVWKERSLDAASAAAASQPEPMETVTVAKAQSRQHRRTTTAIGTVRALNSITLSNELAGTVRQVALPPGQVVEADTVLVALDVSVEEAELKAQQAQLALTQSVVGRMERASQNHGASDLDVDKARAERDVAAAQVTRIQAVIGRKTLKAPFRARIGMSDVHVGQYLKEGTELTTLQGVDDAVNVDFTVAQDAAAVLRPGDPVEIFGANDAAPVVASVVAVDARVDPYTRNASVRARIGSGKEAFAPGASVRVRVPVGPPQDAVVVPVSALRRGPEGDHVFLIAAGKDGKTRATVHKVTSGTLLGDEVVIYSGLAAGDTVAASGSFKLREGVLVNVAEEGR